MSAMDFSQPDGSDCTLQYSPFWRCNFLHQALQISVFILCNKYLHACHHPITTLPTHQPSIRGGSEEIGNREHTPAQHQLSDDCSKRQTKNYICTSSHYLPPVTIFSPYMQLTGACPQSVPIVSTVIERWIVYTVTIQNNIVIHQIYSQNNYSTIQCQKN